MTVELFTGCYRTFEPSMGVPVSITVGQPKFPLGYEIRHRVRELAPFGLMKLDGEEFIAAYRAKLDKLNLSLLMERFEAVSAAEGAERLVLLCFEDVHAGGQLCHRRVFAEWFEERTRSAVPEIPARTTTEQFGQLSLSLEGQSTVSNVGPRGE